MPSLVHATDFEGESRRVAAAFGVDLFQLETAWFTYQYTGFAEGMLVVWELDWFTSAVCSITLARGEHHCSVFKSPNGWRCHSDVVLNESMARGLFALGFEDTAFLAEILASLAYSPRRINGHNPKRLHHS